MYKIILLLLRDRTPIVWFIILFWQRQHFNWNRSVQPSTTLDHGRYDHYQNTLNKDPTQYHSGPFSVSFILFHYRNDNLKRSSISLLDLDKLEFRPAIQYKRASVSPLIDGITNPKRWYGELWSHTFIYTQYIFGRTAIISEHNTTEAILNLIVTHNKI